MNNTAWIALLTTALVFVFGGLVYQIYKWYLARGSNVEIGNTEKPLTDEELEEMKEAIRLGSYLRSLCNNVVEHGGKSYTFNPKCCPKASVMVYESGGIADPKVKRS